ncbi:MAG: hypothetical protein NVSMB18_11060 [Acetobacteraceae bacterium]
MTAWIDWILAGMVLEAAALALLYRRTGRGIEPISLLPTLLAGAMLLLAMRLALGGAWWGWVSVCLLAGLAGHLGDLRQRWRG